jgi:hypothetical protein
VVRGKFTLFVSRVRADARPRADTKNSFDRALSGGDEMQIGGPALGFELGDPLSIAATQFEMDAAHFGIERRGGRSRLLGR